MATKKERHSYIHLQAAPVVGESVGKFGNVYESPYWTFLPDINGFEATIASRFWELLDRLCDAQTRIAVAFTPALPQGSVHVSPVGLWPSSDDPAAFVGLDGDAWGDLDMAGKRRLVTSSISEAIRLHPQLPQAAKDVLSEVQQRMEQDLQSLELLRDPDERSNANVAVGTQTMSQLTLSHWLSLSDANRQQLAAQVGRALIRSERKLECHGLRAFGPQSWSIAQWREPDSGLVFSLLPGGTFSPGFGRSQMEQLWKALWVFNWYEGRVAIRRTLGGMDQSLDRLPEVTGPDGLSLCTPYNSDADCDLRQREPVEIPPMLVATEPLHNGLRTVEIEKGDELLAKSGRVVRVGIELLPTVLADWRMGIPTSDEFEWALNGGRDTIFSFRDDPLPDPPPVSEHEAQDYILSPEEYSIIEESYGTEQSRSWPRVNRFGLAGMLAQRTWCVPTSDRRDCTPMIARGLGCHCWQNCSEWLWLLTAAWGRCPLDKAWFALRPILRLVA